MNEFDRQYGDILVVDHDYWMNSFVCHWLSGLFPGQRFQSARGGTEALAMSLDLPWGLAVVAIEMPGMNGFDLTRELLRRQPGLPIVTVSLLDTPDHRGAARRAGALAHVGKSNMFAELPEYLRRLLSVRSRERGIVPLHLVEDNE